jgi:hypothetical protein
LTESGDDVSDGKTTRRRVLEISIGGIVTATLLPSKWIKPVVEAVVVPAHAQASPAKATPTTTPFAVSDARLKRDIVEVDHLDNGVGLYRYRYIWSDQDYVGVMAQEIAEIVPEAVVCGADGYLRVDYARLGLRLVTWEEWVAVNGLPFGLKARPRMGEERHSAT